MSNTELVPVSEARVLAIREELHALSNDELRERLATQLELSAEHMLRLSLVIRELEERGEDLSDLRIGLMPYLRRIAYGQVAPEVVIRYAGFPALINRIASYPMPDQLKIAKGEPVELLVLRDGRTDVRQVDPLHLSREQMVQVFAGDHVRSAGEQAAWLESAPVKQAKKERLGRVRIDRERGGLVLGRTFFSVGDVLAALAELRPERADTGALTATIPVRLTESEHRALKVMAAQSHCTQVDLVRRAMYAHGLISSRHTPNEEGTG